MANTTSDRLSATLGFFVQGIPAIFLNTDIAFGSDETVQRYLSFYQDYESRTGAKPRFHGDDLSDGYEAFVTSLHELRHFYDALLCRPLFRHFLHQQERLWYVSQLLNNTRGLKLSDCPLGEIPSHVTLTPVGVRTLDKLRSVSSAHEANWKAFNADTGYVDNDVITWRDLIETNAIVFELAHLVSVHGVQAADEYYRRAVVSLSDPTYTRLLRHCCADFGSLAKAVAALYWLIPHCLYASDTPAPLFGRLYADITDLPTLARQYNADTLLKNVAADEARLTLDVNSMRVVHADDFREPEVPDAALRQDFEQLTSLPRRMFALRTQIIEIYLRRFRYFADTCFEHLNELPLPPILFAPSEQEIATNTATAVRASELSRQRRDHSVIRGVERDGDTLILAGLVAFPEGHTSIPLDLVEVHLATRYFYARMFEPRRRVYSAYLDGVYEEIFTNILAG
jgi:hypothetical protein